MFPLPSATFGARQIPACDPRVIEKCNANTQISLRELVYGGLPPNGEVDVFIPLVCLQKQDEIMIKVITAIVCSFAAMVMIILSLATTYWLQWVIISGNQNITHYRGLFYHCYEARDNITDDLIEDDCDGSYLDVKAGK